MGDGGRGGGRGKLCLLKAAAGEGVDVSILEIGAGAHLGLFALPVVNHNDLIGRESGSGSKLQPSGSPGRSIPSFNIEEPQTPFAVQLAGPDLLGQSSADYRPKASA